MTSDIASLAFAIDSSQVVTSMDALTKLQERAASVADSQRKLGRESDNTGQALGRMRSSATAFTGSLADMSNGFQQALPAAQRLDNVFDSLNKRLEKAQKELSAMPDGAESYMRINREAEAMARAFGQTSDGLVGYIGRTNEMRLAADVTATSLDRITRALENQTAAGAAVRAVLQQYGVDVQRYRIQDADKVVGDFVDRSRTFRDSPAKTRDIQAVLGPMGADDLNTVLNPSYVPLGRREAAQRERDASADISRRMSEVDYRQRQREGERDELADLRERFNVDERGTQSETLAELRRVSNLPRDEQTPFFTRARGEEVAFKESPVGRWWDHLTSGRYEANKEAIDEQNRREQFENSGPLWSGPGGKTAGAAYGYLSTTFSLQGRGAQNLFNMYDAPSGADQRPEDPDAKSRRDLTLASQLAGYGETGFMGVAGGRQRLLRMEREGGQSAFRRAYAGEAPTDPQMTELRDARAAAASARTRVRTEVVDRSIDYQQPEPAPWSPASGLPAPPSLDVEVAPLGRYQPGASIERGYTYGARAASTAQRRLDAAEAAVGPALARQRDADQRFENLQEINRTVIRYSERPEERINDATSRARFMAGQEPGDRALSAYVLQQAGQLNVPTSRIENFQGGADFLARGGFSDSQRLAVQQGWEQQGQDRGTARNDALREQIDLQGKLREVSSQGSGAIEAARVSWEAYNAEIKAGGTAAQAWSAAETARQDLLQRNLTATQATTDALREQVDVMKRRNDAVEASGSAMDRAVAGLEADIAAKGREADRARPGTGAGEQTAEQERARLGQQARAGAGDIVASSREQLRLENQILSVSTSRASEVAKLRSDQAVDLQFQDATHNAIASKQQEQVEFVRQQVVQAKALRTELTAIQSLGQLNLQMQGLTDGARVRAQDSDYLLNNVPRADRAREGAVSGVYTLEGQRQTANLVANVIPRADLNFSRLPQNIRDAVDAEAASLPAEARAAFRRTIALEAAQPGSGKDPFSNPAQMTTIGVSEVMQRRASADGGAAPTGAEIAAERERLNKPDAYYDSITMGRELYQGYLNQFKNDPDQVPAATAAYRTGPAAVLASRRMGTLDPLRGAYNGDGMNRWIAGGGTVTADDLRRGGGLSAQGQAAADATRKAFDDDQRRGSVESWEDYRDRTSGRGGYLGMIRRGETGRAQSMLADNNVTAARNSGSLSRLAGAEQARDDQNFGRQVEFQGQLGQSEREIAFQGQLAEAYGQSRAKVEEVTVAYRAMAEAKRMGLSATDAEILKEKMLEEARSRTLSQVSGDTKRARDQGGLSKADAETPWWAGPQTRGLARAEAQADLYIRDNNLPPKEADAYREAVKFQEVQGALAQDQQALRQGFMSMGQAAQSAFADAVLGGKSLQAVIGSLMQDWARMALQMASRQAFNFMGDVITKGLGLLTGSPIPVTGAGGPGFNPGSFISAAGGVFDQGQRVAMFAAGGVVDRPTMFQLAQGKSALVGEAGRPEGVFPLTRTAGGDLGVQVAQSPGDPARQQEVLTLTRLPNGDLGVRLPQQRQQDRVFDQGQRVAMFAAGGVVDPASGRVLAVPTTAAPTSAPRFDRALPAAQVMAGGAAVGQGRAGGAMRDLQVVNNITIQSGAAGKGGLDPQTLTALQRQIDQASRVAMLSVLADERRPGGMLYNG